jgi:hypothetical protein
MDGTSLGLSLINKWCIPWVGKVKRKRDGGNVGTIVGEYHLG